MLTTTITTTDFQHRARRLAHPLGVVAGFALFYTLFFAPVLFSAYLLAPGDGVSYFLPNFLARRVLWDASIWGGFPAVGDSQLMTWYPPAWLGSQLGAAGWSVFIVSAYVLASSFAYGYIHALTRSRLAAVVGGLTYGLCGFMVAHIGHAAIIHAAAWLPLMVWSLDNIKQRRDKGEGGHVDERGHNGDGERGARGRSVALWFVVGAAAVGAAALAGHPQMLAYALCVCAAYALTNSRHELTNRARISYLARCLSLVIVGLSLAAIQLWPTAELAAYGLRASLTFADFVAYSLPLRQVPMLVFPLAYGGAPGAFYGVPYLGAWGSEAGGWGANELTGYVGLLPPMLAALGFVATEDRRRARFWLFVAVAALLLALGDATPLAFVTYHLPLLNKFRALARHFAEFAFAVSVLAGLGIAAIQQHRVSARLVRHTILIAFAIAFACLCLLFTQHNQLGTVALSQYGVRVRFAPWVNPATCVPLVVLVASACGLMWWQRQPQARARVALLVVFVTLDLASFGWFADWHYGPPYAAYLRAPSAADVLRPTLAEHHQRVLPVRGGTGRVAELPPDLSKLWGFDSASGYGPFILARVSRLLSMPPHGSVDASWRDPANHALDLLAVRYVLVPRDAGGADAPTTADPTGVRWSAEDLSVTLGAGCGTADSAEAFALDLSAPRATTSLGVVSALACSATLADGTEVAQVTVIDAQGASETHPLRAGRDTSEWAYDCDDVRPTMKQARAPVFHSYPVARAARRCEGHDYAARLRLDRPRLIKRVEVHFATGTPAALALKKISLLDEHDGAGLSSQPLVAPLDAGLNPSRWRRVLEIDLANSGYGSPVTARDAGASVVFENLRARPRAWLATEALTLRDEEAFAAIRTSHLPDGRLFDPARTALLETPVDVTSGEPDPAASAQVVAIGDGTMEVRTSSRAAAFLITSDVNYPGWRVAVDNQPARLLPTDYVLRGVAVPAGEHVVRFTFQPRSFYYGALVSLASLLALLALCALRAVPAKPDR